MPTSLTSYVHRVGRTARANKQGQATTLVGYREARWFWNEVARTEKIALAGNVRRLESFVGKFSEEAIDKYEAALEQLGQEAGGGP